MFGKREEPTPQEISEQRRPSNAEVHTHRKSVSNRGLTGASALTVRQSIFPITLVTILFFLWGFAYGLLDVLNAKFQTALNITAAKAGGLQGAYFGAYFIGPLTYSGWIVRKFGYRWTFIVGLCIYGEAGVAMLSLVLFFESCVFPTIFTLSIRGLGRHTKRGSSWIVAAVSGGALFPSLTGLLADHKGYHIGMAVPLIGFFVSFVYPIFLNTVYKRELDGFRESKIGYVDEHGTIGDAARDARKASLGIQDAGETKVAFRTEHLEA